MAGFVRHIINTPTAPAAVGSYSQAIAVHCTMWLSGQLGLLPSTGDFVPGGAGPETRQALNNMKAVLEAHDPPGSLDNVTQTTVLLADINDYDTVNAVYDEFFKGAYKPAKCMYQVKALPKGARVEIEGWAVMANFMDQPSK